MKAEIAGSSAVNGNPPTFSIVQEEGDLPPQPLEFIGSPATGATYTQVETNKTIDLSRLADGDSFEIRYTLNAHAVGYGADNYAEAFIGDPLEYGSGIRMQYGAFGDLPVISDYSMDGTGGAHVSFLSKTNFYYILYLRNATNGPATPIAMRLGTSGFDELVDPAPPPASNADSYILENQPIDQPLDSDADGIDDVYELRHPAILNPLDVADALNDPDGDGRTDLREYLDGTDPEKADSASSGPPNLYPAFVFDLGSSAALRSADLNNDGLIDFLSLSFDTGPGVQSVLGEPNESFLPPIITSLPDNVSSYVDLALAKFNDDSFLDAAVVDENGDHLVILLGQGDGRFQIGQITTTTNFPERVATGDINGDGLADLLVISGPSRTINVFTGNGDGTFQPKPDLAFANRPSHVALANFDGDDKVDLAVTFSVLQVGVLRGNGDGTFGAPQFFNTDFSSFGIAAADLDGDGANDIVTANFSSDDISVLLGNGDGTFQPQTTFATGDNPRSIAIADLNGDSRPDLVVSHLGSLEHLVFLNDGSGGFAAPIPAYTGTMEDVLLVDVNKDGRLDIISQGGRGQIISHGLGAGLFDTRSQVTIPRLSPSDFEVVDVNSDGHPDVLVANQFSNTVEVLRGQADGGLVPSIPQHAPPQVQALASGKFDAGDTVDLAVVTQRPDFNPGSSSNSLQILLGNGDGTFSSGTNIALPARPSEVLSVNLNGDSRTDLLVLLQNTGDVLPFLGNGDGTFVQQTALNFGDFLGDALVRDLNGDGRTDLVVVGHAGASTSLKVLLAGADGQLTQAQLLSTIAFPNFLSLADFNGDGHPDLLASDGFDVPMLHYGNADGTFQAGQSEPAILLNGHVQLIDQTSTPSPTCFSTASSSAAMEWAASGRSKNTGRDHPLWTPSLLT